MASKDKTKKMLKSEEEWQTGLESIFLHSEAVWILPSWEYMEVGRAVFPHEITQENTVSFIQGHFSIFFLLIFVFWKLVKVK